MRETQQIVTRFLDRNYNKTMALLLYLKKGLYMRSPCYLLIDLVTLMTSKAFLAQKIDLNPFLVYENYFENYSGAALS